MIVTIKDYGEWLKHALQWENIYWLETDTSFELYTFKWGVAHGFKMNKDQLKKYMPVDDFRDLLKKESSELALIGDVLGDTELKRSPSFNDSARLESAGEEVEVEE